MVAPGADPAQIKLAFEGVLPELTLDGDLRLKTSVNEVIEKAPYAYQIIDGLEVPVACRFNLQGYELSFSLPYGYDSLYPLVIDPELVFVTFSGAEDYDYGYYSFCTTYDDRGSPYVAGVPIPAVWQIPPPQWPTTPGAFQEEWTTIYEPMVCINKYNATGSALIYSTYYGGGGPDDLPHAMIVNSRGRNDRS